MFMCVCALYEEIHSLGSSRWIPVKKFKGLLECSFIQLCSYVHLTKEMFKRDVQNFKNHIQYWATDNGNEEVVPATKQDPFLTS